VFLEHYRAAASTSSAEADLLSLFLIEKAAYEVAYEAANRPAWLGVPLHGLARLAALLLPEAREAAE
jgi:maltose alpha-D-glucosyltransferase/alpha-amylase